MNKELINGLSGLLLIIMIIIGIYFYKNISDNKKGNCLAKGGYVVEDYLGFYDYCVIGSAKEWVVYVINVLTCGKDLEKNIVGLLKIVNIHVTKRNALTMKKVKT